jgi:hypothetical protein
LRRPAVDRAAPEPSMAMNDYALTNIDIHHC